MTEGVKKLEGEAETDERLRRGSGIWMGRELKGAARK